MHRIFICWQGHQKQRRSLSCVDSWLGSEFRAPHHRRARREELQSVASCAPCLLDTLASGHLPGFHWPAGHNAQVLAHPFTPGDVGVVQPGHRGGVLVRTSTSPGVNPRRPKATSTSGAPCLRSSVSFHAKSAKRGKYVGGVVRRPPFEPVGTADLQ